MNPQTSVIIPVPGDPEEARRISARFATVEGRAQEIVSRLRSIESGIGPQTWTGQAADGFSALLAETGPDLITLAASYGAASQALAVYATELAAAQDAARAAQAEATAATEARDRGTADRDSARSDADRHAATAADAQLRMDPVGAQDAEQRRADALGRETAAGAAVDQADQALRAAQQKAEEATRQRDAAAARCIRALEDAGRAGIGTRNLAQPVAAAPQIATIPTPPDSTLSAAATDAELLRAGVADPQAADAMVDRATARLQEIAAQVQAGQPLTDAQREYIHAFAEKADPGALAALAMLAPLGAQEGVKRARAALATSLSAFTDPNRGGTSDVSKMPPALRVLVEDPFAARMMVEAPRLDPHAVFDSLARYEGMSRLLAESAVPMGTDFGEAAGRRALNISRAAVELRDTDIVHVRDGLPESIEQAGHSAAQTMTTVSRNLDSAQALVGDREFRHGLLLTHHLDGSGAAALLDRATARTAPIAADADQNARIARDLFVDLAQDPYGWREEIPKGSAISNEIAMTAAEHIDAFNTSDTGSAPEVRPAAPIVDGYLSILELGGRDAKDVLTFVAAGREPGTPDRDLIALHTAAQAYTRDRVMQAIEDELNPSEGGLNPSTALSQAGTVANAVNTADFRSAVHAYESVDAARSAVYDNASTVAGIAVEVAAGAAPGFVGAALSTAVDKAVEGFEPEAMAGAEGQRTLDDIVGRQNLDANHLIVSTYQQAGRLPADIPDLDAITDETGQVASLDSFRDDQPDPDVIGKDVGSKAALAEIAARGPADGDQQVWSDALLRYQDAASLRNINVDHANPEPRAPLDSRVVYDARRSDR